jgi:transcriptional regulator
VFIQPWGSALDATEWLGWLATADRFGVLPVNNLDPAHAPPMLPTHVTVAGAAELPMHLARPNPVWPHFAGAAELRMTVFADFAYIPTYWRAKAGGPDEDGVPTSYYAAVQFTCRPTIVDDPQAKANTLTAQLADFKPEGRHAPVVVDQPPYGWMLPGIRGVRLAVLGVEARFKYDDHNPIAHRERVIDRLRDRDRGLDAGAASQQRRRLAAIGEWKEHRDVVDAGGWTRT